MESVGVNTCDENAPDSDLAELPSVRIAGIVDGGSVNAAAKMGEIAEFELSHP